MLGGRPRGVREPGKEVRKVAQLGRETGTNDVVRVCHALNDICGSKDDVNLRIGSIKSNRNADEKAKSYGRK
jgi:hypothetical protein